MVTVCLWELSAVRNVGSWSSTPTLNSQRNELAESPVIELNKQILSEASQAMLKDRALLVFRADRPQELLALPGRIQVYLKELRGRLDEVIPDDFGYVINQN